jgi:hypothetical protein
MEIKPATIYNEEIVIRPSMKIEPATINNYKASIRIEPALIDNQFAQFLIWVVNTTQVITGPKFLQY